MITIELTFDESLILEKWTFIMIDDDVFLDSYLWLERKTKRHGFVIDTKKSYSRLNKRDYIIKEEPEVSFDIQAEAVKQFRQKIAFKLWKGRR